MTWILAANWELWNYPDDLKKKNQISRFENTNTGIKNLIDGLKGKLEPLMRREEKKGKGWNKEYAVKC